MTTLRSGDTLTERWQRLEMQVRCALHPLQPERIGLYLLCGAKLARRETGSPVAVQLRMLRTLLRAAQDPVLPGSWRRLCVVHAELPLAHLNAQMRWHDPLALQALEAEVQHARVQLPQRPLGVA